MGAKRVIVDGEQELERIEGPFLREGWFMMFRVGIWGKAF